MNTYPQVFLETSIQIHRFMWRERQPVLLHNLLDKQLHTSCYVFAEFRRTLLRDFMFLYSVVKDQWDGNGQREIHLSDLLDALSRARGVRSERRFRRFLWIASDLLRCFGDDSVPVSDVLEWLDEHIDIFAEEFFRVFFPEFNRKAEEVEYHCSSDCDLAENDRDLDRVRCRREEARCSLSELLEAHKEHLRAILDAFENVPSTKRDNRAMGVLQRLLASNDFETAKGQRNCWPLGDTIIALEVPENVPVYTLDHHFDVICEALGKEQYEEQIPPSLTSGHE
jgi:hypothetical protein